MWKKIKSYIVLLFLVLNVYQGFSCGDCWFSKLETILEAPGNTTFKNFIRNDNDGFAKFENLYKAVGSNRIDELLDPDIFRLFDRLDEGVKIRLVNDLSNAEIIRFSDDFVRSSSSVIRKFDSDPALVDGWKKLEDLGETTLKTNVDWLKRVNDWSDAGVQLSKNGNNLKLSDASGNALGEFKNGYLQPEKYDYPINISSTSVGDVNNGYQVFKDRNGNLSVRRIPDKSPYNASELTELTQHPDAHVLERHGHDVTDDALIKRAQTPSFAPDGRMVNNPPLYSSKFNSADDLREGLNNTKPGTTAFKNAVPQGNTIVVLYTSTRVLGKGVPRNGNSFVNMRKVKAIYRDVGGGNYQLITMYPEL